MADITAYKRLDHAIDAWKEIQATTKPKAGPRATYTLIAISVIIQAPVEAALRTIIALTPVVASLGFALCSPKFRKFVATHLFIACQLIIDLFRAILGLFNPNWIMPKRPHASTQDSDGPHSGTTASPAATLTPTEVFEATYRLGEMEIIRNFFVNKQFMGHHFQTQSKELPPRVQQQMVKFAKWCLEMSKEERESIVKCLESRASSTQLVVSSPVNPEDSLTPKEASMVLKFVLDHSTKESDVKAQADGRGSVSAVLEVVNKDLSTLDSRSPPFSSSVTRPATPPVGSKDYGRHLRIWDPGITSMGPGEFNMRSQIEDQRDAQE